jgi:hypothetical protein
MNFYKTLTFGTCKSPEFVLSLYQQRARYESLRRRLQPGHKSTSNKMKARSESTLSAFAHPMSLSFQQYKDKAVI